MDVILLIFPKRQKDFNNTMTEKIDKMAVLQCFADQEDSVKRSRVLLIVFSTEYTICFLFIIACTCPVYGNSRGIFT